MIPDRKRPGVRWGILLIAAAALTWNALLIWSSPLERIRLPYSEFVAHVDRGEVSHVTLEGTAATGTLPDNRLFITYLPGRSTGYLALLKEKGVTISVRPERPSFPWPLASALLASLVWAAAWEARAHLRADPPLPRPGTWRAHLHPGGDTGVTLRDVAGVDEAKEDLEEIVEFLRHPKKFQALGATIPRGVLLVGPPGTGKTLLARAIAGEAGVPCYSLSGSEFVEIFAGVGAARVRDLFEQAKKSAPCLVFVDEIDAVGRQRGAGLGAGCDERDQTLDQLLVEMDGFDPNSGIIVIAATNRPDILDSALVRPGRFDRRIVVDNPDARGRRAILDVHVRGKPLAGDADLEALARRTPGFSGADLANMVNEAALLAARRGKLWIGRAELDEAVERVIAGPQRKGRILGSEERRLVAYHEAGHALLGKLLPHATPPHKVTILPRATALSYTLLLPQEETATLTRSEVLASITAMLGGRVAKEIMLGEISTASADDFEQATALARKMVTAFGMSDRLGPLALRPPRAPAFLRRGIVESRACSDETAYAIDTEVRRIIGECYGLARQVLTEHHGALARVAEALLERESLESDELDALIAGGPLPPGTRASGAAAPASRAAA